MIVVDTYALVAIAFAEPESEAFLRALQISSKSLINTVCVVKTPFGRARPARTAKWAA